METQEFRKQNEDSGLRDNVTMLDTMFLLLSGFVKYNLQCACARARVCVCVNAFQFKNIRSMQACTYCYKAR